MPSLAGGDMDGNTAGPEEGQYEQILEKDLHQGDKKEEDLGQHPEDKADREVEHEQQHHHAGQGDKPERQDHLGERLAG